MPLTHKLARLTTGVLIAGTALVPATALADTNDEQRRPPDCRSGHVCVHDGNDTPLSTGKEWAGEIKAKHSFYVRNHGKPAKRDHVVILHSAGPQFCLERGESVRFGKKGTKIYEIHWSDWDCNR